MKKYNNFKILWHYLKDEKPRLILYMLLVLSSYLPVLFAAYFWGKALEFLILKDIMGFIKYLALWEGIYILLFSFLQIPRDKIYNYLEIKFIENVSMDLYKKIDCLPAKAFEDIGVGEFINRLYNDPDRVMELLAKLIKLICKALVVVAILILAFSISWVIGLEIVIFGIVMGYISTKYFPKIKKTQEQIKKQSDAYIKTATENITGIREIKSLGIKKNIEKSINGRLNALFTDTKKIKNHEVWYYGFNNLAYFTLQFVILLTCGYFFIQGKITYATFIMMEMYIWRIDEVVESISEFGVSYNKVTVSLKRIDEIINNRLYKDEHFGKKTLVNNAGVIEFKNVKFKYSEDEDYTLNGLNLKVVPNKKIAIVGKSGNGKSTIFNLLLRYFDSTTGEILIDGINIKDLTEKSLRENISIIRQAPFLFNLTILENFKLVKPNVTLKEVRKYCKEAYIDDYIMSLPNKYNTVIGEGGINLSGGQKQRLAIARTLLLNTKIILFDEATSALDNESQEYIKKTINNLVKDHTIIIVAHRLSTIVDADIINIIDKGKLESSGTHEELLKTSKVYKTLYSNETSSSI
ncbi:aBC-type multidrug transport system ATPase and permease component [Mycoplasma sp. CAG:877]|nr:aBC-type multidrug transport system ATPase and permease component [Mycoplasma sp. CAG:877]